MFIDTVFLNQSGGFQVVMIFLVADSFNSLKCITLLLAIIPLVSSFPEPTKWTVERTIHDDSPVLVEVICSLLIN